MASYSVGNVAGFFHVSFRSISIDLFYVLKGRGFGPCVKVMRELTSRQGKRQGERLKGKNWLVERA